MKIIGFDCETTGFIQTDHRLVEIFAGLYDTDTRKMDDFFFERINPERSMPADAQRVHHISSADLTGCPNFTTVAPSFVKFMRKADVIVAHNGAGFDLPFVNMELTRVKQPILKHRVIDTMLDAKWACPDGKSPTLGDLCFACDVPYDVTKAHAAQFDVEVMMECFFKGLDWGFFKLPELESEVV